MPTESPARRAPSPAAALVATLLLLVGCARAPVARHVVEKTRLARLPAHYRIGSIAIAADGWAYAVVATGPDGDRVVSSRGADPAHALALLVTFLPKSHRFVYWVSEGHGDGKTYDLVADDGTVHRTGAFLPGPVAFSDDGARWAAMVLEPGEPAGTIAAVRILVNGEEMARHADATLPSVSPDGTHVAYLTATDGGGRTLWIDGVARRTFEAPGTPCARAAAAEASHPELPQHHVVRYLADGRLLVVTRDADGWGIYRDGTRLGASPTSTFDRLGGACRNEASLAIGSIRVAEESGDVFWWERLAGEAAVWRVVKNGAPVDAVTCSEPWRRHPPEVSADGRTVVYPCSTLREGGAREVRLVRNGEPLGTYVDVWGLALSPNGAHTTYAAADEAPRRAWAVFVDGAPRAGGFDAVWRPRVTDDGTTVAWQAKRDGEPHGRIGIDARALGSFDDVLWGPELEGTDRMAWVVRRGRSLTRISAPIAIATQRERPVVVVPKPAPTPS